MSFARKVIVAVGLTDSVASTDGMEDLKEMSFLKDCEIHFVHVFETINYSAIFGEFTAVYPVENERDLIEKSVIVTLTKSSKSLLPKDFSGKIYYKCLFGENPKLPIFLRNVLRKMRMKDTMSLVNQMRNLHYMSIASEL